MLKVLRWLLRLLSRFDATNEAVLTARGSVLLLPNHVSRFEWLFLGVCLDCDRRFVTSAIVTQASPAHRGIMTGRHTFPIDPASP